jgi:uncharacterized protein YbjT (DUF2867 family)
MALGWPVRGTSRREGGRAPIEALGIEAVLADPLRPDTVLEHVADVSVVHWLLGSAEAEVEALTAIHGPLLKRTIERLVETPVRGIVYEAAGRLAGERLEGGAQIVRAAGARWQIPVEVVAADPRQRSEWAEEMAAATLRLVS